MVPAGLSVQESLMPFAVTTNLILNAPPAVKFPPAPGTIFKEEPVVEPSMVAFAVLLNNDHRKVVPDIPLT